MIIPQARIAGNGDLCFPKRGEAPKAIQGYIRDKYDKFVFHPILLPCRFRTVAWTKVCGGMCEKIDCKKFNTFVTITDCLDCKVREE